MSEALETTLSEPSPHAAVLQPTRKVKTPESSGRFMENQPSFLHFPFDRNELMPSRVRSNLCPCCWTACIKDVFVWISALTLTNSSVSIVTGRLLTQHSADWFHVYSFYSRSADFQLLYPLSCQNIQLVQRITALTVSLCNVDFFYNFFFLTVDGSSNPSKYFCSFQLLITTYISF